MATLLVTPPASEPLTLADPKAHLRLTASDEDTLLALLIAAARRITEARTGLRLMSQQWTCFFDDWPEEGIIDLPIAPVTSVAELAVYGEDDVKATIDPAHYYADTISRPPTVVMRGSRIWQSPGRRVNGIAVTVNAGFGASASAVPEPLRQAMLIMIAHWYEHRGNAAPPPLPLNAETLIQPYRQVRL